MSRKVVIDYVAFMKVLKCYFSETMIEMIIYLMAEYDVFLFEVEDE